MMGSAGRTAFRDLPRNLLALELTRYPELPVQSFPQRRLQPLSLEEKSTDLIYDTRATGNQPSRIRCRA